jgi:hypothetical protein
VGIWWLWARHETTKKLKFGIPLRNLTERTYQYGSVTGNAHRNKRYRETGGPDVLNSRLEEMMTVRNRARICSSSSTDDGADLWSEQSVDKAFKKQTQTDEVLVESIGGDGLGTGYTPILTSTLNSNYLLGLHVDTAIWLVINLDFDSNRHSSMQVFAQAQGVDASHSVIQEIHGNQINISGVTRATQIYRWLSAPDPSSNQDDAYKKRQKSTGTWFVGAQQFADWRNDPRSFILLFGMRTSVRRLLLSRGR